MERYHVGMLHEVHNEWLDILCPLVDVAVVGHLAVGEHQHRSTCFKHTLAFRNRELFKFTHLTPTPEYLFQTHFGLQEQRAIQVHTLNTNTRVPVSKHTLAFRNRELFKFTHLWM